MDAKMLDSVVQYFSEHWIPVSLSAAASLLILSSYMDRKRSNLPPGPTGIPIFGYIPFFPTNYGDKVKQLFAKYGKIFSVRLGSADVVFVSDVDVIKRIMNQDVYNNRPDFSLIGTLIPDFLGNWNGEKWKEQRKFSLRILRHLGVGKQEVEEAMLDEIEDLIQRLELEGEKPLEVHRHLGSSVTNAVTLLVTGERFDVTHPTRVLIDDCFLPRGNNSRPSTLGIVAFMPWISKFLFSLPGSPAGVYKYRLDRMEGFLKQRLAYLKNNFDAKKDDVDCFMKAYLKEMAENQSGKYFNDVNLIGCAFAFFAAAAETSGDVLTWFMLYMMLYPDVQKKMQQEIDNVIGRKRVSVKYRDAMPYTQALTQELHRVVSAFPTGVPHAVSQDTQMEGYFLPKGTQVLLALHAVHSNPEYFEKPDEFRPERFISKEGTFIRDERVIPFGYGKRSCPGQPVAETEIFLYMTCFLQHFEVLLPEGKKYGTEGVMEVAGRIPADSPIEVVFKKRTM